MPFLVGGDYAVTRRPLPTVAIIGKSPGGVHRPARREGGD